LGVHALAVAQQEAPAVAAPDDRFGDIALVPLVPSAVATRARIRPRLSDKAAATGDASKGEP